MFEGQIIPIYYPNQKILKVWISLLVEDIGVETISRLYHIDNSTIKSYIVTLENLNKEIIRLEFIATGIENYDDNAEIYIGEIQDILDYAEITYCTDVWNFEMLEYTH